MNNRFETFSFLPPLSQAQIQAQARDLLKRRYVPTLEFSENPSSADIYWDIWPIIPPKGQTDHNITAKDINASLLMMQIEACSNRHPYAHIRLSGYDTNRHKNAVSFIVKTPVESI